MLQQSTNPPPIVPLTKRATPRAASSPLSVISANVQPVGPESDLLDLLCYMKDENDVRGMMDLYEYFATVAEAALDFSNTPRTTRRAEGFMETENGQAWAKAHLVADFLKDVRPNRFDVERYSEVLFRCTLQMGNRIEDAVAVVNEIASWDLPQPLPSCTVR